jgi:ATP-dependent Clp protease protease subunit
LRPSLSAWLHQHAAVILASGEKGKRFALPNAEVMIHQPLGGAEGQASDIEITAKHILSQRVIASIRFFRRTTGQPLERIEKDVERDYFPDGRRSEKVRHHRSGL